MTRNDAIEQARNTGHTTALMQVLSDESGLWAAVEDAAADAEQRGDEAEAKRLLDWCDTYITALVDRVEPPPSPLADPEPDLASVEDERNAIDVDHRRLSWGLGGKPDGDIRAAYSGDRIPDGKIRKPFKLNGVEYITGGMSGAAVSGYGVDTAEAWRIVPLAKFKGETRTYGDGLRPDEGFYHGIKVKRGRDWWVIVGPAVLLIGRNGRGAALLEAAEVPAAPAPAGLFDGEYREERGGQLVMW